MSTGNPQFNPRTPSKQEIQWEKVRVEVEKIADALGKGIDEGIKETVIAFSVNGIPTSQSCEGHLGGESDHGYPAPWITVKALNKPKWRHENEEQIYEQVAEQYGVNVDQVLNADNEKAWVEAQGLIERKDETTEYKKWNEENKKLFTKVKALLEEFYAGRDVPEEVRIVVDKMDTVFEVHNGGKFFIPNDRKERLQIELTKKERQCIPEVLKSCQKEMQNFAEFLKNKYFSNENQS